MTPATTSPNTERYRLVTRSDFDGLVCAALLKHLGILDDILFVHPKDVQDGKVELTAHDITTNLPWRPEVHLSFDHHSSELARVPDDAPNRVMAADAASAARVVYDHFGGAARFPEISADLMRAVDQADSADYTLEDILRPEGWTLHKYPGPGFDDVPNSSAEASYYTWVDHHNAVGFGNDVPISTANLQDGFVALVNGQMVLMRVPYPMGYYAKGLDARIDDPNAGWKGRGLWSASGDRTPWLNEIGNGARPMAVHIQVRPDPLAH